MDSTNRSNPYAIIRNNQEVGIIDIIKTEVFDGNLPEGLSQLIFSSIKISDLKLNEKKWEIEDKDLASKVELARLCILLNKIVHQIENIKNQFGEIEYPYVYVVLTSELNMRNNDPQTISELLQAKRQMLIENISLLSPTHIKQLKIDSSIALPIGFAPSLLDVAWHFSWVRYASGDAIDNKFHVDNCVSVLKTSLGKICELGGNDWQLCKTIIKNEKTRNKGLFEAVKYLISKNQREKAREVAETISDPEIRQRALKW